MVILVIKIVRVMPVTFCKVMKNNSFGKHCVRNFKNN